jgi:hypothetical protein
VAKGSQNLPAGLVTQLMENDGMWVLILRRCKVLPRELNTQFQLGSGVLQIGMSRAIDEGVFADG